MTKAQMKPNPRMAPPFSGRDLLDGAYGIMGQPSTATVKGPMIVTNLFGDVELVEDVPKSPATEDHYKRVFVACACGSVTYLVDERQRPYCPQCFPGANDGMLIVDGDDLGPQGKVVKLSGNGKRPRTFEFFAGGWFQLDSQLERLPKQVTKPSLLLELNRRGKIVKPIPEMKSTPRPYTRFIRTAAGHLREYPSITEPECSCADEDMHEHYALSALGGTCARHGATCGTCGEIH